MTNWGRPRHRRAPGQVVLIVGALMALAAVLVAVRLHARPGVMRTISLGHDVFATVAADGSTGRAFIAAVDTNGDGRIFTINTHSGLLLHTTRVGAPPSAVVVDDQTQRVFVANENSASVGMLDAQSGRVLRTLIPGCPATAACTPAMGASPTALVIDTGTDRVFVGGEIAGHGVVSVVDAHNGAILYIRGGPFTGDMGGGPMAVDARRGYVYALGSVAETRMSVLDARSGLVVRAIPVGPNARAVVVDEPTERLLVLSDAGLGIIDARSARLLHTSAINSAANDVQVDEASGRVVIANATGAGVSAYDGHQGTLLWRALAGVFVHAVAVDPQRGHVIVSAGSGVFVLDARSGATLRAIALTGTPGALALDERSGRTIVVTYMYAQPASDPWAWLPAPLRRWLPPPRPPSTRAPQSSVSVLDTTR